MMTRDAKYWDAYKAMKRKHPDWAVARLHAAVTAMKKKEEAT